MIKSRAEIFGEVFDRRDTLAVIGQGTYHRNYLFEINGESFVLRVRNSSQEFDLRVFTESATLKFLEKVGFYASPKFIFSSRNNSFIVISYMQGVPIDSSQSINEPMQLLADLHLLGRSSRKLRSISSRKFANQIRAFGNAQMSRYAHFLESNVPGLSRELSVEANDLAHPRERPATLLHGDPARSNFLKQPNGRLCLLDFELAAFGDSLLDFALLLNRAFTADRVALNAVLSAIGANGQNCNYQKIDLLGYSIFDVARSIHVVAAKYLDPTSSRYDLLRGQRRLEELLRHRSLLKDALAPL